MNCTIYQSVSQLTMTDRNVIAEIAVTVMTVLSQWPTCHTYTHSVITVSEVSHLHTQYYHSDRGVTPTHSVITVSEVSHLHTVSSVTQEHRHSNEIIIARWKYDCSNKSVTAQTRLSSLQLVYHRPHESIIVPTKAFSPNKSVIAFHKRIITPT